MLPVDAVNTTGLPSPHALTSESVFKTIDRRLFAQFSNERTVQPAASIGLTICVVTTTVGNC